MTLGDVLLFSIHPWRLLELAAPHLLGGPIWELDVRPLWGHPLHNGRPSGIFPTLYAGAFALVAVFLAWRSRSRGARFARVLLCLSLAAAVVPSLLPESAKSLSAPLPLRNPEKLAVAATLALALFAAIAFDAWKERPRRDRFERALLAVGAAFAVLAAFAAFRPERAGTLAIFLIRGDPARAPLAAASLPRALSEAGLLWMATVVALDALGARTRRGQAVALALLTLVPVAANRRIARSFTEGEVFGPTAFARFVARRDPEGAYRTLGESFLLPPRSWPAPRRGSRSRSPSSPDGRGTSRRPCSGRGEPFSTRTSTRAIFRASRVCGEWPAARRDTRLIGVLRSSRPAARDPLSRSGADRRLPRSPRRRSPGLGREPRCVSGHPPARDLARGRGSGRGARRDPPPRGRRSRSRERSLGAGPRPRRHGSGRREDGRAIDAGPGRSGPDLALRAPGVLALSHDSSSTALPSKPFRRSSAFRPCRSPRAASRLVWREELPGIRISRWGPLVFGMIVAGLLVAHSRRRTT